MPAGVKHQGKVCQGSPFMSNDRKITYLSVTTLSFNCCSGHCPNIGLSNVLFLAFSVSLSLSVLYFPSFFLIFLLVYLFGTYNHFDTITLLVFDINVSTTLSYYPTTAKCIHRIIASREFSGTPVFNNVVEHAMKGFLMYLGMSFARYTEK